MSDYQDTDYREVTVRGVQLIQNAIYNKDAAFSLDERERLGLRGLLPPRELTIDQQMELELEHVRAKNDVLENYIGLVALDDRPVHIGWKPEQCHHPGDRNRGRRRRGCVVR